MIHTTYYPIKVSQFKDLARVFGLVLAAAPAVGTVVPLRLALGGPATGVARWEDAGATQADRLGLALALTGALLAEAEETVTLTLCHNYS